MQTDHPTPETVALIALAPLMLMAIWWDLRAMRIPNWLTAAVALLFAPFAAVYLDGEAALWRIGAAATVLVVGYALFFAGRMGGGDVKLMAACALHLPGRDVSAALLLLSFWLAIGLAALTAARWAARVGGASERMSRFAAFAPGAHFPMGISIGAAMLCYLALAAAMPGVPAVFWFLR